MKNNTYPCKSQFYYIKVGFKGVKNIKACFYDEEKNACVRACVRVLQRRTVITDSQENK